MVEVDSRETMVDVGGQEIMTADKVTLRLNAVATYKIVDARKALGQTDDVRQAVYRDTQLVLRAAIGARIGRTVFCVDPRWGGHVRPVENRARCASPILRPHPGSTLGECGPSGPPV